MAVRGHHEVTMKVWAQWRKWRRISSKEWIEKGAYGRWKTQMEIINAGEEGVVYNGIESLALTNPTEYARRKQEIASGVAFEKKLITSIQNQGRKPQSYM
jgi:hypothetical protein